MVYFTTTNFFWELEYQILEASEVNEGKSSAELPDALNEDTKPIGERPILSLVFPFLRKLLLPKLVSVKDTAEWYFPQ